MPDFTLESAANAVLSLDFRLRLGIAVVAILAIVLISYPQSELVDAPASIPCLWIFSIFPFFHRRHHFLNWGFRTTGQSIFQFRLFLNTVVVVSGENARQTFFSAQGLDLTQGFKMLSGAIPIIQGVTSDLHAERIALIYKRLAAVQRNAHLSSLISPLLEDTRKFMQSWGSRRRFDPFDKIHELFFQLTIRSLFCHEVANDPALVARLKKLYDTLDASTTPATVLAPWFPTPSMLKKLWATKNIHDIVVEAIHVRKQSKLPQHDTLQILLDSGDDNSVIVGFIIGLIIAGARATGATAAWMMTFLGSHSSWNSKAVAEVGSLLRSHVSEARAIPENLSSCLALVPLEDWESKTPVLDAIIKETTRLAQPHTALRRNIGPPVHIDGKMVPTGTYVLYPFSDVHLNDKLYSNPWAFDPGRLFPKAPLSYVGWGGGRTLCLGTRLAKLELKLVSAMFLLGFRYSTVDSMGQCYMPTPNWNDILFSRPPSKNSAYLQIEAAQRPL